MPNFFTENSDILFHFDNLNIEEIVTLIENNFKDAEKHSYAPTSYADALESYRKILEIVGDISGNFIAPRADSVDEEGVMQKVLKKV